MTKKNKSKNKSKNKFRNTKKESGQEMSIFKKNRNKESNNNDIEIENSNENQEKDSNEEIKNSDGNQVKISSVETKNSDGNQEKDSNSEIKNSDENQNLKDGYINEEGKIIKSYIDDSMKKMKEEIIQLLENALEKNNDSVVNLMEYNEKYRIKPIEDNNKYIVEEIKDNKNILIEIKKYIENNNKGENNKSNRLFNNVKELMGNDRIVKDEIGNLSSKINSIKPELMNDIKQELNKIDKNLKRNTNNILDNLDDINYSIRRVKEQQEELCKSIELLEGKMKSLDKVDELKEQIEKIHKSINKKNIVVSNLEEEILTNLGQYGEKIVNELTMAARCYAKNKDKIEYIDDEIKKYEKKIIDTREDSRNDGIWQGKRDIISEIINKCDRIDNLYDSENDFEKIIKDMLINNGFERDIELKVENEICVTEENQEEIQEKAHCKDIGKYKVTRSAILLNGKIYKRAELEKIEEDEKKTEEELDKDDSSDQKTKENIESKEETSEKENESLEETAEENEIKDDKINDEE